MDNSDTPGKATYDQAVEVQSRYTDYLMQKRDVVGVSVGIGETEGLPDPTCFCVVVLVAGTPQPEHLPPEERIPQELDGVPVKVQEIGEISAQGGTFDAGG